VIKEHVEHSIMRERTVSHLSNNQTCQEACIEKNLFFFKWSTEQTFFFFFWCRDCRQYYWLVIACACAIPLLLQLSESSFKIMKCIMYMLAS